MNGLKIENKRLHKRRMRMLGELAPYIDSATQQKEETPAKKYKSLIKDTPRRQEPTIEELLKMRNGRRVIKRLSDR